MLGLRRNEDWTWLVVVTGLHRWFLKRVHVPFDTRTYRLLGFLCDLVVVLSLGYLDADWTERYTRRNKCSD
jgi:hypothetical protein